MSLKFSSILLVLLHITLVVRSYRKKDDDNNGLRGFNQLGKLII